MELSTNAGGTLELVSTPYSAFHHFQALSNELSTPKILLCPQDKQKRAVTNFARFGNKNLSYFVNLDAIQTNGVMILAGERWIDSGRKATNGVLTLTRLSSPYWTFERRQGVVGLADGSVSQWSGSVLKAAVRSMPLMTNRLARPD
jgi:hypothetical protein